MEPIPLPVLLDDDEQLLGTHDLPSAEERIRDLCEYGRRLWHELEAVRAYLLESTADGRATPAGADDERGWQRWQALYADVIGALAGPRGDAGFAAAEARAEVSRRRVPGHPSGAAARGGQ